MNLFAIGRRTDYFYSEPFFIDCGSKLWILELCCTIGTGTLFKIGMSKKFFYLACICHVYFLKLYLVLLLAVDRASRWVRCSPRDLPQLQAGSMCRRCHDLTTRTTCNRFVLSQDGRVSNKCVDLLSLAVVCILQSYVYVCPCVSALLENKRTTKTKTGRWVAHVMYDLPWYPFRDQKVKQSHQAS